MKKRLLSCVLIIALCTGMLLTGTFAAGSKAIVTGDKTQAVTNVRFKPLGKFLTLCWTYPSGRVSGTNYCAYASKDCGDNWIKIGSTSGTDYQPTNLAPGMYNAFKIESIVNNSVVADVTSFMVLNIIQNPDLPAAQVTFTPPVEVGEKYTVSVAGATPNTDVLLKIDVYDGMSGSFGAGSDANGNATIKIRSNYMSDYYADVTSAYLVQEYGAGTVSNDGRTGSFTVATRGKRTYFNGSDAQDASKKVTNLRFEMTDRLLELVWDAPAAAGNLSYRIYVSDNNGFSWTNLITQSNTRTSLTRWEPFSFNAIRVLTLSGNTPVAEVIDYNMALNVNYASPKPPADMAITPHPTENNMYNLSISGLTPNTRLCLSTKWNGYYNTRFSMSDEIGLATGRADADWLDELRADPACTYLVQEYSDVNVDSRGKMAAYTVIKRGNWTLFSDVFDDGEDVPVASVPMHRMYDPNSGEHFYTGSEEERNILVAAGWNYEGVAFNFPAAGAPVYRLYNPATGDHLYTMDEDEMSALLADGWNYENVAFNSAPSDQVPQYRLWNPNAYTEPGRRGAWHFTSSVEERDHLVSLGWQYQGIGWYSEWA